VTVGHPPQQIRQEGERGGLEGGDAHGPTELALQPFELGLGLLCAGEQRPGMLCQRKSGVGQPQSPSRFLEQWRARLALQGAQLLRYRRRRVRECLGYGGDRAAIGELAQETELAFPTLSLRWAGPTDDTFLRRLATARRASRPGLRRLAFG
jgi:hypothetical protein